ncbi:terminase (plasmid) [Staphylococcus aureus]|nr:terminase [Staphylococcus aureus]UXV49026.1 terminase [Staphylococcus aureus]
METNFVARVNAIINNFERNVRKAQKLAKTAIPTEVEIEITANTNKLQKALTRAKAMTQKWREHTINIDGDANPVKKAILATKAMLNGIRKHTVNIDLDVNKWDLLKSKMVGTWHNGGKALGEFSDKMDHLAGRIRSFGTVFGQQIKGLAIASVQALIPVIAGLVPAVMAVGNALKVVSGGAIALAGALGIAAGGFVAFGALGVSAIKMLNDGTLQATKATESYKKALQDVKGTWADIVKSNQNKIFNSLSNGLNAVSESLKGLTPFISGVAGVMEDASKNMLEWTKTSKVAKKFFDKMGTTGVSIFGDLVKASGQFGSGLVGMFTQFMPLFKWSSQWLQRIGEDFNNWVNSARGENAIKQFMNYTKQNLPIIGEIFKNTFSGINNLFKAFGQNSTDIFKWLADMTKRFSDWSKTIGETPGFRKFIDYVKENSPVIMDLIGNIVRALVAFGTAMAPIAGVLLDVINKIADFVANLFEAHPNIARFFGSIAIAGGVLWALVSPLMFVSSIVTNVFGMSLFKAGKMVFEFIRNSTLLSQAFGLLKKGFGFLMSPIGNLMKVLPLLGGAIAGISAPVWAVIGVIAALVGIFVWLWKTNDDFRNKVTEIWNNIRDVIGNAIDGVTTWLTELGNKISETLKPIMPILQQVGDFANEYLGNIFVGALELLMQSLQGLWTLVSIVFTAIGTIISAGVQLAVGLFTSFIQFLSGDFSGVWDTLMNTISNVNQTIWEGLQNIWSQVEQFLFDTYNRLTGETVSSWSEIWASIEKYVSQIWDSVSNWFNQTVSTIGAKMSEAYNSIVTGGGQWVESIRQAMYNFWDSVVQKFNDVVKSCRQGMQNAVDAIRNFFGNFTEVGQYLMQGLENGISAGIGWVVDAAYNVAKSALDKAKSALGIASPSREFKTIGMFVSQGLGIGIANQAFRAINAVKDLSNQVVDAFDAELIPTFGMSGLDESFTNDLTGFITNDVRHSITENMRPIVNIEVKNEGDLDYIRSVIRDKDAKEYYI